MHLLYDLTPRLPLLYFSPLPSTGDAAGTCATGFHPARPSPQRLHLSPGLQGHHGHHPAAHAHALRGGMPRGGGFFCLALWCSHLFVLLLSTEPKSDWLKIESLVMAVHLGVMIFYYYILRNCSTNWMFSIQQHQIDKLEYCNNLMLILSLDTGECTSMFITCLQSCDTVKHLYI